MEFMKTRIVGSLMPNHVTLTVAEVENVINQQAFFDILELRIDAIKDLTIETIEKMIEQLRQKGFRKEVLITFRTEAQGGARPIEEEAYQNLLQYIAGIKHVDFIDVEWEQETSRSELVQSIQSQGVEVIISYHNFQETPKIEVLKKTYYHMSQWGGTHLKIAVMPQSKQDVLTLLQAVSEASEALSHWVTGISMSSLGVISRTAQATFGGALSYGSLSESVAPGQLDVKTLKNVMALYQPFENYTHLPYN